MHSLPAPELRRWIVLFLAGVVSSTAFAVAFFLYWKLAGARTTTISPTTAPVPAIVAPAGVGARTVHSTTASASAPLVITMSRAQQEAIGLTVATAVLGVTTDVIEAPGRIVPDETKFAYITPRAAGIVRTVKARIGQDVPAGFVLAMIDSPEVAQARFELSNCLVDLANARTNAERQAEIYKNTQVLINLLRANRPSEEIQEKLRDRPVGENREKLLTAYVDVQRLYTSHETNKALHKKGVVNEKALREVRSEYEKALAAYESLMDQMGFANKRAKDMADQELQKADTKLRVAREQLRVLGLPPDGTEPEIRDGKVVGLQPDGSLPTAPLKGPEAAKPEAILGEGDEVENATVMPVGAPADDRIKPKGLPVSTYAIWAPFDGTVIERELIVPGVSVDTTHKIFTLADLSSVWIEVDIHESRFGSLARSHDATVVLTTPAYPGRRFPAEVIYTGDTVDLQSRSIKLLARAENRDRALKPGMFVYVALHIKGAIKAIVVPEAAVISEDRRPIVFVQTGPDRFERRMVRAGATDGAAIAVLEGLMAGEKVVVEGAFKLKAMAFDLE